MDNAAIYQRVKSICCSAWHISPVEYDRLCNNNELALEDVMEALLLYSSQSGIDVKTFLFREDVAVKKKKAQRIREILHLLPRITDEEKRKILVAELEELNKDNK